jgi:hypothetical protein
MPLLLKILVHQNLEEKGQLAVEGLLDTLASQRHKEVTEVCPAKDLLEAVGFKELVSRDRQLLISLVPPKVPLFPKLLVLVSPESPGPKQPLKVEGGGEEPRRGTLLFWEDNFERVTSLCDLRLKLVQESGVRVAPLNLSVCKRA